MRWNWFGRGAGAACAVAGCMPMLAALIGGAAGSAAANVGSTMMMAPVSHPTEAGWLVLLGRLSWPLLLVSIGLIVWSFWRTARLARALSFVSVALLVVNRLDMSIWWFLPAMAVLAAAFLTSALASRGSGVVEPLSARPGTE